MDRTVAVFLIIGGIALVRLIFATATGRARVGIKERADRRTDPFGFWLFCLTDMAMIAACVTVLLGWRPFGAI